MQDDFLALEPRPEEAVLDDVYLKYANSNPFLPVSHFIDHATMGAEALVGLQLGTRVPEWITHHKVRAYTAPSQKIDIARDWAWAVGKTDCHGDWIQYFESELERRPYGDVLREWIPRFVHQCGVFLFHGLIRTAHAIRALEHRNSPARRGELARGLALWAIGLSTMPRTKTARSENLDRFVEFARAGASAFVAEPTILHLHLVTSAMAYMIVGPYLDGRVHHLASDSFLKSHSEALRGYEENERKAQLKPVPNLDRSDIDKLAEHHDAHPAKLTEAALRAYRHSGDDVFIRAAGEVREFPTGRGILRMMKAAFTSALTN